MARVRRLPAQPSPLADTPRVIWALVGVNLLVYVLWNTWGRTRTGLEFMLTHFVHDTAHIERAWTLLTSAFSQENATHFLFNMFALWVFGGSVARVIGERRLLLLYLVGGVVASLGSQGLAQLTGHPVQVLGASGAVMAIAVVYAGLFPRRRLYINFLIPVPAVFAVAGYVLLDALGLFNPASTIAHMAHLGGAAAGLVYWLVWVRARLAHHPPGK